MNPFNKQAAFARLESTLFQFNNSDFESLALEVFRLQYNECQVYREYCQALGVRVEEVNQIHRIPFLPVGLFKTHDIHTSDFEAELVFASSGTTGMQRSQHRVRKAELYRESFRSGFERFYGPSSDYCILALLPGYLERPDSSLVYMVDDLIRQSKHSKSGFYLDEWDALVSDLNSLKKSGQKTLLIGVSFALADLAERYPMDLSGMIVMETGGMKGRRKEITREELHAELMRQWNLEMVHSEYGMTELLSQAYSKGSGLFRSPPWMRVLLRDEEDPLHVYVDTPVSGAINVIDLANLYSCSFIATEDLGRLHPNGSFEVLGRLDNSDIRGCSLLYNLET